MQFMADRLLAGVLNLVIMSLISAMAGAALFCAYSGVLDIFSAVPRTGVALLISALALSIGAALTINYRNDLVDKRYTPR